MKRDKEAAGNFQHFLLPFLGVSEFQLIGFVSLSLVRMIMAMIIFMRSAGINGITQIPRAALKVESATMQNHTVPKR